MSSHAATEEPGGAGSVTHIGAMRGHDSEFFRDRRTSTVSDVVDYQPVALDHNTQPNLFRHHYCASFAALVYQRMGLLSPMDEPGNFFPPEFSTTGTPRPYCCCAWCCRCAAGDDISDLNGVPLFEAEWEIEWPLWGQKWENAKNKQKRSSGAQKHARIDTELGQRFGFYYGSNQVVSGADKCEAVHQTTLADRSTTAEVDSTASDGEVGGKIEGPGLPGLSGV
jgi:hypothetical protein